MKKEEFNTKSGRALDSANKSRDAHSSLEQECLFAPSTPSEIATRVQALKRSTLAAVAKRERLPRTLFWSLFHTEIEIIKRRKEKQRLLEAIT